MAARQDGGTVYDILIVGGGAAGLGAAVTAGRLAAEANRLGGATPLRIGIVEKKETAGRKLAATGNGRCNLSNTACPEPEQTAAFFRAVGIMTKTDETGRMYPYSEEAGAVVGQLTALARRFHVEIRVGAAVTKVETIGEIGTIEAIEEIEGSERIEEIETIEVSQDDQVHCARPHPNGVAGFLVYLADGTRLEARRLLLATGGKSQAVFGTTGDGYRFARQLGHTIHRLVPALTPIRVAANLEPVAGVRTKARVSLYRDGRLQAQELGEVQWNRDNLSGLCILNLSRSVQVEAQQDRTGQTETKQAAVQDAGTAQIEIAQAAVKDAGAARIESAQARTAPIKTTPRRASRDGHGAAKPAVTDFSAYRLRLDLLPDMTMDRAACWLQEKWQCLGGSLADAEVLEAVLRTVVKAKLAAWLAKPLAQHFAEISADADHEMLADACTGKAAGAGAGETGKVGGQEAETDDDTGTVADAAAFEAGSAGAEENPKHFDFFRWLASRLKGLSFQVTGTAGWKEAQVTRGGVPLDEVDPKTMESRLVSGLYFAGEVLDYDGPCGGFNLDFAWRTGMAAGQAMVVAAAQHDRAENDKQPAKSQVSTQQ